MVRPVIVSTWSFALRGHDSAWPALCSGGSALDAVEAICRVAEDDPRVDSVGWGGLPDAQGHVTVDGAVMVGPDRVGAVAAMRAHRHAVSSARAVMDHSRHILLVGRAADEFADAHGIERTEMCSEDARQRWEQWTRCGHMPPQGVDTSLIPQDDPDGRLFQAGGHDTIGALALDHQGVLAGACSTSGMPFKTPGRVGDSPIIGHGLYVEQGVGAVTATGVGERISAVCGAMLAIEALRRGATPLDAAVDVLRRIDLVTSPHDDDQIGVVVLNPDGVWAAAARRPGFKVSVTARGINEACDPQAVMHA